jgi:surfactin synthase thioesterase subunit
MNQNPTSKPRLRVFAFPCASAGPTAFQRLAKSLDDRVELSAIHLPGRESRINEPPADFRALELAVPVARCPIDAPMAAYGGQDDFEVSAADLHGWGALTRRSFKHREFPGGHFFIQAHPGLVAAALLSDLESGVATA